MLTEETTMLVSAAVRKTAFSLCLLAFCSSTAIADANPQGGTIQFVGQIVESPCNVNFAQQRLAMSCNRSGHVQTRFFSTQELINAPQQFQQIATMKMHYLDADKKLAVMNIDYH